MAYFAPYINETGIHIPTYPDIRDDLVKMYKSIFGDDVYLENDSQDYQLISIFADKTHDALQQLQEENLMMMEGLASVFEMIVEGE